MPTSTPARCSTKWAATAAGDEAAEAGATKPARTRNPTTVSTVKIGAHQAANSSWRARSSSVTIAASTRSQAFERPTVGTPSIGVDRLGSGRHVGVVSPVGVVGDGADAPGAAGDLEGVDGVEVGRG